MHPMDYRRPMRRRRRIRTILIVSGICLAVALLLFFWIGNIFFDKLDIPEENKKPTQTEQESPALPASSVKKVQAPMISLRNGTKAAQKAIQAAAEDDKTALSLSLCDREGNLLYRSEVAKRLSMSIGTGEADLSALCATADSTDIYLCGIFTLKAMNEENPLDRSVYLSEAAAVIAEAYSYGLRDIVLRAPSATPESVDELLRLHDTIKSFESDLVLGLALPDTFVASPDAEVLQTLAYRCDYLALDLSRYGEEEPADAADAQINTMLYYLLRYEMRVIIPAEAEEAVAEKVAQFNLQSHMTIEQ